MAKLPVQFKSAAMRHKPHHGRQKRRGRQQGGHGQRDPPVLPRVFLPTLGPFPNRMRTTMAIDYQSNSFCDRLEFGI